jgi:hypothetical protein
VLYLGILWMSLLGELFHAYPRLIHWGGVGGGGGFWRVQIVFGLEFREVA